VHLVHAMARRHGVFVCGLGHADLSTTQLALIAKVDTAQLPVGRRRRNRSGHSPDDAIADLEQQIDRNGGDQQTDRAHDLSVPVGAAN
jgi:hypothetical protein